MSWRTRLGLLVMTAVALGFRPLPTGLVGAEPTAGRMYEHRLVPVEKPRPILAAHPEFVAPIRGQVRFEAPTLVDDPAADLAVRAWRFSYNARSIIEIPNRLRSDRTALIVVHPWGIDDGQGWRTPQPAGVAFQCTPEKNELINRHIREVVNPLLKRLRGRLRLVLYSLPGREDTVRRQLYRSVRGRPAAAQRRAGRAELARVLGGFRYRGQPLPERFAVSSGHAVADYFAQIPGLDAGAGYNNKGFWKLPVPVHRGIDVDPDDVVIYDAEGYELLKSFLRNAGVRHILLAGYNTDMCVCSTTAGYENLRKDFNVFLVGDATVATFPAQPNPAVATSAAVAFASLKVLVTETTWIRPVENRRSGGSR